MGFATLPNQVHRKSVKKGFDFTLMVAGRAGAGQSWARGVSGGDGLCVCVGGGIWVLVAQSCPTLCEPMDCSSPGFSVHGILRARTLEWVAISFSRGGTRIFPTQGWNPGLLHCRRLLYCLSHWGMARAGESSKWLCLFAEEPEAVGGPKSISYPKSVSYVLWGRGH